MIKVENINKVFTGRHTKVQALKNISLEIKEGEFLSIIGPSGSGKSTLLLTLGGMSSPTSGKVFWKNDPIYEWKLNKRADWRAQNIGFVFQTFNLLPYLNVYDNVQISLSLSAPNGRNGKDILSILNRMGLSERLEHLPSELSVGQQQRVALARALVKNPHLILADEPTGNLDPGTASEIINILKEVNKKGKTVVLVTHDPNLANLSDRSVKIVDGEIRSV
ncbi:MAG: ABC transporter ATP-binding protein [Ignavibacteriales bacterium]|nr:ABC transporter ATP-binding protein [Ignavibacteriales bacterium]